MSLDQLMKKLKPAFLAAASNEHRPFRLFLSTSDMKARAIVRHASGDTPADARTAAVDNLKAALGSRDPIVLRADWITDVESMTWSDFNNLIGSIKRNEFNRGVAFSPDSTASCRRSIRRARSPSSIPPAPSFSATTRLN